MGARLATGSGGAEVEERQNLLERVPLFAGISTAGIEELGAIADEVESGRARS